MDKKKRKLVVCCDGTSNNPYQSDRGIVTQTNVLIAARAAKIEDGGQLVYYDIGVGNGSIAHKALEGLSGIGLSQNIRDAYEWLVDHYQDGDEIYMFGFSRGAFTVGSLCGFLDEIGLLKKSAKKKHTIIEAYNRYKYKVRIKDDKNFITAKVKFLGVWDTVASLGFPLMGNSSFGWNQHHKIDNFKGTVENCAHALALDEKRKQFKPKLMHKSDVEKDFAQKWFSGVHTNIGGGYIERGLSDIALNFVLSKAEGLALNSSFNLPKGDEFGEMRKSWKSFYILLGKYNRRKKEVIHENELYTKVVNRVTDQIFKYSEKGIIWDKSRDIVAQSKGQKVNMDNTPFSNWMVVLAFIILAVIAGIAVTILCNNCFQINYLFCVRDFWDKLCCEILSILFALMVFCVLSILAFATIFISVAVLSVFNRFFVRRYYQKSIEGKFYGTRQTWKEIIKQNINQLIN